MGHSITEGKYEVIDLIQKLNTTYKTTSFKHIISQALHWAVENDSTLLSGVRFLAGELAKQTSEYNSLQTYFDEVGSIYRRNKDHFDIEYSAETREELIEMNLKSVISIAKRYQGLGLSMQELISAGNLGLIQAWDKFDPARAQFKENLKERLETLEWPATKEAIVDSITDLFKYGDILDQLSETLTDSNEKDVVFDWIDQHIKNAKFSSIAVMWIKASILGDIDEYSRVVKKPKSEIYKDKLEGGTYKKEIVIDIDEPAHSDQHLTLGDTLGLEEDSPTELEVDDAQKEFQLVMNRLFEGVDQRDRAIMYKKFGISTPRAMSPKEISQSEGVTIARVSQIYNNTLKTMRENAEKYGYDLSSLVDLCAMLR
nr:MAG TPA: RNA polymerase sigma factor [Caudoviricetes sp.]